MRKSTKIWLIIASALVFWGVLLFVGTLFVANWDFSKLGTAKYKTNTYKISEDFGAISIDADTADIKFLLSQNGSCKVECFEEEKAKHTVKAENGTLSINEKNEKAWYEHISIGFSSPKITVYLPKAEFDSITVKESTGDVYFSNLSVKNIDLTLSTGDVFLSDIKCENLITKGSTGEVELKNVIASKRFNIERSTGEVEFTNCDAEEIFIETDTGDVEGSLLSSKVFIAETNTGKVRVPKTTEGGRCEIYTSTGDVKIEVKDGI